jgi:hypothetical protein
MTHESEMAATAFRVLNQYSSEFKTLAPWRWQCVLQNGARLAVSASVADGFLELACRPGTRRSSLPAWESALSGNGRLPGGARLALNEAARDLHLRTDIVLLEEKQIMDRMAWALDGFHLGVELLGELDSDKRDPAPAAHRAVGGVQLGDLLRESSWGYHDRGPNNYSAALDADAAPPASLRMVENGLELSVEMVRCPAAAWASRRALAIFLLTVGSASRLVRAHAQESEGVWGYRLQVLLPSSPEAPEIDHALGALSVAYRTCAREIGVLLDDAAARCYLAVRGFPVEYQPHKEKENKS